ncbi:MAG: hypothetical protein G3M70_04680 [Candidatus Nitronauta litoralis]|uniref:Uncharacterized protein n=1 Tax=Candidatus Nitronauta litoralis TaxID=2705533 RepID=A0A7T0BUS1_9BACT|nr:MAG: hypothetical protein G3M70_04680 [Candidatus Nitronauta litoralis]
MSEEEKNNETPPEEPSEKTAEPGQELDDAIHALAPEEPDPDLDPDLTEEDFNPEDSEPTDKKKETPPGRRPGRGFFDVLVVLVLAGLGVGEYLFVERQKAQQRFLNDRFTKIEQSIQSLENRKPSSPSAPSAEIQSAIDNLSSQIQELKGQVNTTRDQQQETVNWVKGELEKVKSAPPAKQEEPEPEEPEEEPQEVEEAEPETHEPEAHGSDDFNPEESFIDFVENLGAIVIDGIKDGVVFVWNKLNDLIDPPADSPAATPASK